jgi:hypothetical protein
MAFGVMACKAINAIIALLVGSAIAWKMSRLMSCWFIETVRLQIYTQLIGFTSVFLTENIKKRHFFIDRR